MNPNLLVTKIVVPSRRNDVLCRQRLLDFVHEYVGRKLLLISASAGYGKTSLLVDFANDTELPVCWYSLEESDADPQVFVEYLVAAIQRKFPHFGGRTLALMRSPESNRSLDAALGALVNEIHEQIDTFFVIVLDDYHLVEHSEPVNQLLDRLLFFLPENAHVILASRTVPQHLTLTRLTARLQVAGLGTEDLRFSAEEIRELVLQNYRTEISEQMAQELASQSEGWITGIVLTSPTMWQGLLQEWIKGYNPGSQLFEYLANEVLAQQSPELQQFLLDTSVLNQMDVELCNELLGPRDSLAMFQLAEKRNLFITRLAEEGFRYHHLFREFLFQRLRQTQPKRFKDLQQRAAAVFERRGLMDQAIELWLAAGESSNAARLVEIVIEEYHERGRWETLDRWFRALPIHALGETPKLYLWSAILSAETGRIEEAREKFVLAIREFQARQDTIHLARTLIESARYQENLETAIEQCNHALSLLPAHEYPIHALAARTIGTLKAQHGDCAGAIPLLKQAVEHYEIANQRYEQSDAENQLGTVRFLCGDRAGAMTHFENARTYWQRVGNAAKLANTMNSIAVTRYQQGELELANHLFLQALNHSKSSTN
jgi:ATP/maltotriose-dependent transcriptional regulator MalT